MAPDRPPRVSVIVVSFNRASDLRLCLQALIDTGYPDLELIVVDNASRDGSAEVAASFPQVRLVRSETNLGFAGGNDLGLTRATGAYVALVNDDAVVEPAWVQGLVDFMEAHPEAAAAGGKAHAWNDARRPGDRAGPYYSYSLIDPATCLATAFRDTPDQPREVATLSGCAVMIRRRAIDEVGPVFLHPDFFTYYEETDFFARVLARGWRLYYTGLPAVWHRIGAGEQGTGYRYQYYMHRNRVLFAYRNASPAALARLLRRDRRRALRERLRRLARFWRPLDEPARARRDARRWVAENRELLERHRASSPHALEGRYQRAAEAAQARGAYYLHERPEVAALVPPGARRVVDVGCGAGALGRLLKASRPGIEVRGVEIGEEPAARARAVLDDVMVGPAEATWPGHWPAPDCIVLADVLEHLRDPWSVLGECARRLAPGGAVVVSVPNVGHRSVVGPLLRGRWDYQDAGILDRTHLRFFTRDTALEMVAAAGLRVARIDRVVDGRRRRLMARLGRAADRAWLRRAAAGEAHPGPSPWALAADRATVQFLLVAERA